MGSFGLSTRPSSISRVACAPFVGLVSSGLIGEPLLTTATVLAECAASYAYLATLLSECFANHQSRLARLRTTSNDDDWHRVSSATENAARGATAVH